MHLKQVKQKSEEWHKLRAVNIGSSDFATLAAHHGLCENLYKKSLKSLAKEKINPKIPKEIENDGSVEFDVIEQGHIQEEVIKKLLNFLLSACGGGEYKIPEFESSVAVSDRYDYLMSSMDCYTYFSTEWFDHAKIFEVKNISPFRKNFEGLYSYYMAQMAHQFFIASENFSVNTYLVIRYPTGRLDFFEMVYKDDQFILYDIFKEPIAALELSEKLWLEICYKFWNTHVKPFITNDDEILLSLPLNA